MSRFGWIMLDWKHKESGTRHGLMDGTHTHTQVKAAEELTSRLLEEWLGVAFGYAKSVIHVIETCMSKDATRGSWPYYQEQGRIISPGHLSLGDFPISLQRPRNASIAVHRPGEGEKNQRSTSELRMVFNRSLEEQLQVIKASGLQPTVIVTASNLPAMASNLPAMASNLLAMASNRL